MRYVGIDIASEKHFVAVVDGASEVLLKSAPVGEDEAGYSKLFQLLGESAETLVAMEATGHYWKNLYAALAARGFAVALLNPVRTRRFAEEDLQRTKTDAIDALGIARFAAQKRPPASRMPDSATEELRELVRHRDRLVQEFGDKTRQLHRLVDLGFPEFKRYVRQLDSALATAILADYPTAQAFAQARPRGLANLKYDGHHLVGLELATTLIEAARHSVGAHHGYAYRLQVKHACQDLDLLRQRLRDIDRDIEGKLDEHEVGSLLTTIDGIGPTTAAKLIAELGNPADFTSPAALAAYCRRRPSDAPVRESARDQGGHHVDGPRRAATCALDASPDGRAGQSLAAPALPPAPGQWEAAEGRPHRRDAQAAACQSTRWPAIVSPFHPDCRGCPA